MISYDTLSHSHFWHHVLIFYDTLSQSHFFLSRSIITSLLEDCKTTYLFIVFFEESIWYKSNFTVYDMVRTARGSIPGRNGVFIKLHVLRKGQ